MKSDPTPSSEELTLLLQKTGEGDQDAANQLAELVYPVLKQMATRYLQRESRDHTLQPTELVNEVYLKLFGGAPVEWKNRAHFFAVVALQMRHFLVDYARKKKRRNAVKVTLTSQFQELTICVSDDLIALDEALTQLETQDARACRVVELRFFGGLTEAEAGEALKISPATVKRDWEFARAWLLARLEG